MELVENKVKSDTRSPEYASALELVNKFDQKFRTEGAETLQDGVKFVSTRTCRIGPRIGISQTVTLDSRAPQIMSYIFNPELRKRVKRNWLNGVELLVEEDKGGETKRVRHYYWDSAGVATASRKMLASASCIYSWSKGVHGTLIFTASSFLAKPSLGMIGPQLSELIPSTSDRMASQGKLMPKISLDMVAVVTPLDPVGFVPQTKVEFRTWMDAPRLSAVACQKVIDTIVVMNGRE
jgi:hypothetical protein